MAPSEAPACLTDPRGVASRVAGLAGLDPERLRRWLFARCVVGSSVWGGLAEVARTLAE